MGLLKCQYARLKPTKCQDGWEITCIKGQSCKCSYCCSESCPQFKSTAQSPKNYIPQPKTIVPAEQQSPILQSTPASKIQAMAVPQAPKKSCGCGNKQRIQKVVR